MNIYIMVDSEGISGLVNRQQNNPTRLYGREGRAYMTAEVNACAEACKEAGVQTVYVRDAHDDGSYIHWDELCPAVDYIIKGSASYCVRHAGIEDCDGVILLGYHAMTDTEGAILAHTMDGGNHYYVNGVEYGEIAIDAALCQKPVIMVSGDDKACAEATNILPWAITAEVKKGVTWRGAMMLPIAKAHYLIKEKTIAAINNFKNTQTFTFPHPITLRAELTERGNLPMQCAKPYMKIIDGRTYEVTANTLEEALFRL